MVEKNYKEMLIVDLQVIVQIGTYAHFYFCTFSLIFRVLCTTSSPPQMLL